MPLHVEGMVQSSALKGRRVFLSGSIPDPRRWDGYFDAFEITDAVVAAVRAVLTASGRLVCAVHPTIAPLLLNVASAFPIGSRDQPIVVIYQSRYFERELVTETRQLTETKGLGEIVWTPAAEERTGDDRLRESLRTMRIRMLRETDPAAAVFVGGMEGVNEEFAFFREFYPGRGLYPISRPGGAAARLVNEIDSPLQDALQNSNIYPFLMERIVDDVAHHL